MDRGDKIDVELMSNAMWHGTLAGNTPGNFINKMVPPIKFDNGTWKVAVSSVQYEHSWRRARVYKIWAILFYPENEEWQGKDYNGVVGIVNGVKHIVFELPVGLNGEVREIANPMAGEKTLTRTRADLFQVNIPIADDQPVEHIGTQIAFCVNAYYRPKYGVQGSILKYEFDTTKQRSKFTTELGEIILYLEGVNRDLCPLLGYDHSAVDTFADRKLLRICKETEADLPPRCSRPATLMIYSKIVDPQRCGDANVQLLAKVPVRSKFGDIVQYEFNRLNPKALKYGLSEIDEIDIQINDHAGHPIDFTSGITNLSLIFTKAKEY